MGPSVCSHWFVRFFVPISVATRRFVLRRPVFRIGPDVLICDSGVRAAVGNPDRKSI